MKKRILTHIFILTCFLILGLPGKVSAAKFHFNPSSGTLDQGCVSSVNIDIDPEGRVSNAAEAIITYNPNEVEIIDSNTEDPGIQIRTGNAYQNYIYNVVDTGAGRITLAAGSFNNNLQTRRIFATVQFRSGAGITSTSFNIQFNGFGVTNDSNIADSTTNLDLLDGVTNATYTFQTSDCENPSSVPQVQFLNISNGQTDVPLDSNVLIRVTDELVDIDLNSIVIMINGRSYTILDSELTFEGSDGDYTFTLNPEIDFPDGQSVIISIGGQNVAGVEFYEYIIFNTPGDPPLECENVVDTDPETVDINEFFNSFDNFSNSIFDGTIFEGIVKTVGASGVVATGSLLLSMLGLLPFLYLLTTPGALLKLISILWGKRVKRPWGVVTDTKTGKPVAFAVCELFSAGSQYRISQTVTDLDGRYGFVITAGNYRLEIKQSGYKKFVKDIEIKEGQESFVYDVELVPLDSTKPVVTKSDSYKIAVYNIFDKVSEFFFIVGFAFSIFAIIFSTNLLNILIFLLYCVIILGLFIVNRMSKRGLSSVINSDNNLRVPYAKVKLFDAKTGKMVDAQVSNYNGYFDFYSEPGEYALTVSGRGYNFPGKNNKYKLTKNKKMVLVTVKKGRNKIDAFVDPVALEQTKQEGDNLDSPFN